MFLVLVFTCIFCGLLCPYFGLECSYFWSLNVLVFVFYVFVLVFECSFSGLLCLCFGPQPCKEKGLAFRDSAADFLMQWTLFGSLLMKDLTLLNCRSFGTSVPQHSSV